jgi:sortase A
VLRMLERLLMYLGAITIGVFVYAYGEPKVRAAQSISDFSQTQMLVARNPDMALWSTERIEAFSAIDTKNKAIGILSIKSVAIEAPIYRGTDDDTLDQGIGWIAGTTQIDGHGNVGLAAHRDGIFRGLKDIAIGDQVMLTTLKGDQHFKVTGTDIVDASETYVLEPTSGKTLTLVTCHPFYFVGNAPNRFVVFATAIN